MYQNNQLTTWTEFATALELRFGLSTFVNHEATLYKLTQTTDVAAYQATFESLSNRVHGLTPSSLLNCFLSGLHLDIQHEFKYFVPHSYLKLQASRDLLKIKWHLTLHLSQFCASNSITFTFCRLTAH